MLATHLVTALDVGTVEPWLEISARAALILSWPIALALHWRSPGTEKIVPAMISMLDDDDLTVVALACDGLGGLGAKAKQAVPALQKAKNSPHFIVQQAAEQALKKIRGR